MKNNNEEIMKCIKLIESNEELPEQIDCDLWDTISSLKGYYTGTIDDIINTWKNGTEEVKRTVEGMFLVFTGNELVDFLQKQLEV